MKKVLLSCLLACLMVLTGCGDTVPPGKTVIILKPSGESKIISKGVYKAWGRDRLYFVDGKLKSFKEEMQILCEDDINMRLDVKTVCAFDVSAEKIEFIKQKVPAQQTTDGDVAGYELSLDKFYSMVVGDIVRGTTRNIVSKYQTDNIRPNREAIENEIARIVKTRVTELKFPLTISAILVSNIDYPPSVTKMREDIKQAQLEDQKQAALAEATLAQVEREVAIETEKAKVRAIRAEAQATENQILSKSLTPEFLMWRQMEVMESVSIELAKGESNTVFMMPYQSMNPDLMNTAMVRNSVDKLGGAVEKAGPN